jgi:CSLREA domain-containing protein
MKTAVRITLPLLLALSPPARAAVFTVTKTADTLDGACDPYDCSLREAVTAANMDEGTDVIELPAGVYTLTRVRSGEDQNTTGDLDVNSPLILVGAGAGSTVIDGNGTDRVLDVRAETEIFGVTVRNGLSNGPGGGVYARAAKLGYNFVVRRSVISGNRALGSDGGGLMIETAGLAMVLESTLSANRADANGGGLASSRFFWIVDSTVSGNSAGFAGGGLYYPEELSPGIAGATITANQAGQSGGGIYAVVAPNPTIYEAGLRGSIVAGNTAPAEPDCYRGFSAGYNVIGAGDGCFPTPLDRTGTGAAPLDPKLGPLASQGGPTPVHALLPGSPAIDLVPAAACTPGDQIGQARSAPCEAGAVEKPLHSACLPGGPVLCLQDGRFRVTASWSGPNGAGAAASAVPLTDDTGSYWFFSPDNLELVVKVLDGCAVNSRWWVFSSGLTDRGVELRVEDLATGSAWTNTHAAGTTYPPRLDSSALDVCNPPGSPFIPGIPGTLDFGSISAVFVPTKGEDTLDGACDSDCSLREAVTASNTRSGTEVIILGPGVYTLSRAGRNENGNATGDLDITGHLVILGQGADRTTIDGGGIDRVLEAAVVNSSLEIHGATIRNGRAETGDGGAIRGGVLTLIGCHVTGSSAATWGGGFAGDTVTARDTTVSDNQADGGGGIGFASTLRLTNVTVSGNRAATAGGGLIVSAEDQELDGVTIAGNSAPQGGGLYFSSATCPSGFCRTDFSLAGSIVAGNSAADGPDCYGLDSDGNNVFGIIDAACGAGPTDRAGTVAAPLNPKLTPLGDHGGSTPTHALLAGSPAIDNAPASDCLPADQRHRLRPAGLCDAGAVERLPGCQPDATTLCLGTGDRFRATARWAVRGESGDGQSLPLALDSGAFWFFNPSNLELTLKVLDGCGVNGRFWVFLSGLTDVGAEVTVEDTLTGKTWTHNHPAGSPLQPRLDTNALDICPEAP